jgi:hypothetical protein
MFYQLISVPLNVALLLAIPIYNNLRSSTIQESSIGVKLFGVVSLAILIFSLLPLISFWIMTFQTLREVYII